MPRKSNKTAHVLNLLAGQDTTDETENEKAKETESGAARPAAPASTQSVAPAQPDMPSNISIVDNGAESDPVAEKIRDELLKSLGEELEDSASVSKEDVAAPIAASTAMSETTPVAETMSVSETASIPEATVSSQTAETPSQASAPQTPEISVSHNAVSQPAPTPSPESAAPATLDAEPETSSQEETEEIIELAEEETPAKEEAPAEPEPDYVILNVMQEVVEDKIIYFMKQFDVCTCDRCRADTIALTLSGLPAQYKVVDKAAVAPLVSYYASRLISQVTVEALKACTEVRENPRH